MQVQSANFLSPERLQTRPPLARQQSGVVLIIALILLIVISLLAVTSLRNAGSSESVSSNVRTTELASQAAEIALRYCEAAAVEIASSTGPYTTTFPAANILPGVTPPAPANWQNVTAWDAATSSSTMTFALALTLVNQSGMTMSTYRRAPECMIEQMPAVQTGSTTVTTTSSYVITARGFGPEVPAVASGSARIRPVGSEVWMQSSIELGD